MSVGERQTALRFSLGFGVSQIVFLCAAGVAFVYLALQYWFHFDEVLAKPYRRRFAWFGAIANTNDGKTGVIIWAAAALLLAWLTWNAGRRFLSSGKAAMLTQTGLLVHPTYRRTDEIPFADIRSAKVWRERYFFHVLRIGIANGRPIEMWAKEIEGGKDSLQAFAAELNARRAFEGGKPRGEFIREERAP